MQGFPSWQVLLVDIRCHGESANLPIPPGPHGVESSAQDILKLLSQLKLFPEVLIGHSFGGKVVMSMGEQFGASGKRLPRPVQVQHTVYHSPCTYLSAQLGCPAPSVYMPTIEVGKCALMQLRSSEDL